MRHAIALVSVVSMMPAASRAAESIEAPFENPCAAALAAENDELTRALIASAIGLERLSAGDARAAIGCLELAKLGLPTSSVVARDLAAAYYRGGLAKEALVELDRAIALGDTDPEVLELRALILAGDGREAEAADAARSAETHRGDLIAAVLGDGRAAHRASELAGEATSRGALTSLVLASHAAARGEETAAKLLLEGVDLLDPNDREIHDAAIALGEQLQLRRGPRVSGRIRAAIEHATNPAFLSEPPRVDHTGIRFALLGEAALHSAISSARVDAALRFDKHVFLTERSTFSDLDLLGLTFAGGIELPISRHPQAARIGLRARFTDTFGSWTSVHYASSIEGGPNLIFPMSAALRAELAFYGIATDFIDKSPPDAKISSLNRDIFGQRAVFALAFGTEWLEGRAEAMFLRDDALGDAFDALGGALAVNLRAHPSPGVVLMTGAGASLRDYGPVGDLAIIGPAATRTELRTAIHLGAKIEIFESVSMVIEDLWVRNSARRQHSYTENVLTVGVEQTW